MSSRHGYTVPIPFYIRHSDYESLYAISQRPLEVFRHDKHLIEAPITGWNALWRVGTHTGIILASLGYQVTEATHLLTHPAAWLSRLNEVADRFPEAAPSVAFFTQEFSTWPKDKQVTFTEALRTKLELFTTEPAMRALVGAAKPGINWQELVEQRKFVLLDFRHIHDVERRRFLLLWALRYFLSFIKHRGAGFNQIPVSLLIDEVSLLTGAGGKELAEEFNELLNVYGRNNKVWLTTTAQELYQFEPLMQKMLLSSGTQLFASTSDIDTAITLARNFFDADSWFAKYWHPIYMALDDSSGAIPIGRSLHIPRRATIVDWRPEFMDISEQHYEQAKRVKNQKTYEFFVRSALAEGANSAKVHHISIQGMDEGLWINQSLVARARQRLAERSGIARNLLLTDIDARVRGIPISQAVPRKTTRRDATMNGYEQYTYLPGANPNTDDDDGPLVDYK
jgi:hypothetical protein